MLASIFSGVSYLGSGLRLRQSNKRGGVYGNAMDLCLNRVSGVLDVEWDISGRLGLLTSLGTMKYLC